MLQPSVRHRFRDILWYRPTDTVELACVLLLLFRALWLLHPRFVSLPERVQEQMTPTGFSQPQWGWIVLVLAIVQLVLVPRRAPRARGHVATLIGLLELSAAMAYYRAGLEGRAVVGAILAIALLELWIAWRCWHDQGVARVLANRRREAADACAEPQGADDAARS